MPEAVASVYKEETAIMSVQVETLEKNMAKVTVEVPEDKVEAAIQQAYVKQRGRIRLPGFRKGKVPRKMIEKMYGPDVFYEDAANQLIRENWGPAADESGIEIVSRPMIDITQMEAGKPFIFTAEVAVKPEVKLGEYKGISVTKADVKVTDEEVEQVIEREREQNARSVVVEDRGIENGDTAVIDFEGFLDGEAFEGGKAENHSLEIGSHSFVDTFEEQLVGRHSGDEVEVHVTFPEEYHDAHVAGKPATFAVKIHEIRMKEMPELDDEFAQDVSEFDTLDEYRQDVRRQLEEKAAEEALRIKEDEAVGKVVELSSMEIPDAMIDTQVEVMVEDFVQRIESQGLGFEQYMQFSGLTVDKLKEQMRPEAITRIERSLVLEQIVKEENIETSEEELAEEIDKITAPYGKQAEKLKEQMSEEDKNSIRRDYALQKAADLIVAAAVEVEEIEE